MKNDDMRNNVKTLTGKAIITLRKRHAMNGGRQNTMPCKSLTKIKAGGNHQMAQQAH